MSAVMTVAKTPRYGALIVIVAAIVALYVVSAHGRKLLKKAERGASTVANAPLQLFRDQKADGSTVGTEAWVKNQVDGVECWLGIGDRADPLRVYQGGRVPDDIQYTPDGIPIAVYGVTGYK